MSGKNLDNLVVDIQQKWASIVVEISKAYKNGADVKDLISNLLHDVYAFDHCNVLFKPTLAKTIQFRTLGCYGGHDCTLGTRRASGSARATTADGQYGNMTILEVE